MSLCVRSGSTYPAHKPSPLPPVPGSVELRQWLPMGKPRQPADPGVPVWGTVDGPSQALSLPRCTQVAWTSVWSMLATASAWPSSASCGICSATWRPSARRCPSSVRPGLGSGALGGNWQGQRAPCSCALPSTVASKPGTCVKVLTIEPPPADPRLREDMALLADCALPPELRVSAQPPGAGPSAHAAVVHEPHAWVQSLCDPGPVTSLY